ncbi:MAG: hypothetical protein AAF329_08395 [Cyanobacteria bacterium P01_A01_bin.17]
MSPRNLTHPLPAQQHVHTAFGLTLLSDIRFPELSTAETPDANPVTIRLQEGDYRDHIPEELLPQPLGFQVTSDSAVVYLKGVGVFLLQSGTQVTVIPAPEASPEGIRQAITGIVMALICHQRGRLVLHGSAVSIAGKAVVFLADSGEGKSSMAAALHAQGHLLLTDDLTVIDLSMPMRVAIAGTPIKLNPQMAQALQIKVPSQPLPSEKHLYHIDPPLCEPQELDRIFILSTDPQLSITPLSPQKAVTEIMRFAGLKAILPARDSAHFSQCVALAQACPLYQLRRPKALVRLPEIAAQIAQDITK